MIPWDDYRIAPTWTPPESKSVGRSKKTWGRMLEKRENHSVGGRRERQRRRHPAEWNGEDLFMPHATPGTHGFEMR